MRHCKVARAFAMVGLFGLVLSGCEPVTLQAAKSVNPLLLGPVHKIGGGSLEPTAARLVTSQNKSASASSSTTQSGNVQTTTTTSSSSKTATSQTDYDLALAAGGKLDSGFAIEEIDCDGYFYFLLNAMISSTDCEITAGGVAVRAPAVIEAPQPTAEQVKPAAEVVAAPTAAGTPPTAGKPRQDVVATKTGRKLRGKILVEDASEVMILLPTDETVRVPRSDVETITYGK